LADEKTDTEIASAPPAPTPSERVESWKEIAAYLERDVRTVQRWEKKEALPVYRHMHDKLGTVYAYKIELDAWWNNRRPRLELEEEKPEEVEPAQPGWLTSRRLWLGAAVAAVLAAVGAALVLWPFLERRTQMLHGGQPNLRRIAVLDWPFARLSPDGKWLAHCEARSRHLLIREMASGQTRTLAGQPVDPLFAWAPDSRRLAFVTPLGEEQSQLETIDIEGKERKTLWQGPEPAPLPLDWSDDSNKLLVAQEQTLGILRLPQATINPLVSLVQAPSQADLSPDGNWAVYSDMRDGNWDIFLVPARGGKEVHVVSDPAIDSSPFFSNDGQWIVFWSNRRGWGDLWGMRFSEGQPMKDAALVYADIGRNWFGSVSRDNAVLLNRWRRSGKVELLPVDSRTGVPLDSRPQHFSFPEDTFSPFWQPGGQKLFYLTRQEGRNPTRVMAYNRQSGGHQEVLPRVPVSYFMGASFAPDGRYLLFFGEDFKGYAGIFTYDLQRKEVKPLIQDAHLPFADWSPDGGKVTFAIEESQGRFAVRVLDIATGRHRTVAVSRSLPQPRWSPDGAAIAYRDNDRLLVVPAAGGASKELVRFPGGWVDGDVVQSSSQGQSTWSPDGKRLACVVNNAPEKQMELWVVDYPEGTHRSILVGEADYASSPRDPAWSPDGRHIAFSWTFKPEYEISVLTGLPLPQAPADQPQK